MKARSFLRLVIEKNEFVILTFIIGINIILWFYSMTIAPMYNL